MSKFTGKPVRGFSAMPDHIMLSISGDAKTSNNFISYEHASEDKLVSIQP